MVRSAYLCAILQAMKPYNVFLTVSFVLVWVWAAIEPIYRDDWFLENCLVFVAIIGLFISLRWFRFSNASYGLITLFLILHVIGSHYTYAEVPFGYTLQELLGESRNMYDRMVHFSYGLLLAYPTWEVFRHVSQTRGLWTYYIPVEMTLAASALYEIMEWYAAATVNPAAGIAFLGAQGDIWDAQKDMWLATVGAVIAMFVLAVVRRWRRRVIV